MILTSAMPRRRWFIMLKSTRRELGHLFKDLFKDVSGIRFESVEDAGVAQMAGSETYKFTVQAMWIL